MDMRPEDIPGHIEAMRDLASSMEDEAEDFTTWFERFKAKEAAAKAKEEALRNIREEIVPNCVEIEPNDLGHVYGETKKQPEEWTHPEKKILTRKGSIYTNWANYVADTTAKLAKHNVWDSNRAKHNPNKPLRQEIFNPPPEFANEYKKRGLAFTIGKTYPIYGEALEPHRMAGVRYITVDDNGNRRSVNAVHFNPEAKLVWNDVVETNDPMHPVYSHRQQSNPVSNIGYSSTSCISHIECNPISNIGYVSMASSSSSSSMSTITWSSSSASASWCPSKIIYNNV